MQALQLLAAAYVTANDKAGATNQLTELGDVVQALQLQAAAEDPCHAARDRR